MTSIIVYNPKLDGNENEEQTGIKRRAGMLRAGADLRKQLNGVVTDTEVEAAVHKVVRKLVKSEDDNAFLETGNAATPTRFEIGRQKRGNLKFRLLNGGADTNKRLRLKGFVDDLDEDDDDGKRWTYRMSIVSPDEPKNKSWNYLAKTVFQDLLEIEGIKHNISNNEEIENYLIATFAFTRCR